MSQEKRITLGITGASGAIYAVNLLKNLTVHYQEVHLMISDAARIVMATEIDLKLPEAPQKIQQLLTELCECSSDVIKVYSKENWYSPVASGSAAPKQMVVCPASMGCVSAIATGASNTLLERAADVVIKEQGQLILLPREMPFSTIHLRNLLTLSEAGVTIMPAAPGLYGQPESIDDLADFVSARVLNHLGIDNQLGHAWGYKR
ncbi:flavin prenyltransferase UbiX [Aliikangiella coralliicola]|uniref:Flavin prenyltransferase UbiX n=1 Tax=Aliikangiella coralliicola TaxID=2592383 RepID=A0A545TW90_9GAMM|nr:flavin prenyltransferase UbiX [Aliikangiella coralliicola]TQV81472.1 UbiX family flavin prenyltransferase [Aliikangiella coralliicola]